MKLGDLVYRVIPYDPPDGEQTWEVLERRIAQVRRDGKLVLERPFPGQAVRIVSMSSVDSSRSSATRARCGRATRPLGPWTGPRRHTVNCRQHMRVLRVNNSE